MTDGLQKIQPSRRTGNEEFYFGEASAGFKLIEFWQWSSSDLVSNTLRGVLAEFIVAKALGISTFDPRDPWRSWDLQTANGLRIEVKSAARIQSWSQKALSNVQFVIRERRGWDPETNKFETNVSRHANIYVFAILDHEDKSTVDPLNLSQWKFIALPSEVLNERTQSQHSITLRSLTKLAGPPLDFWQLRNAVERMSS